MIEEFRQESGNSLLHVKENSIPGAGSGRRLCRHVNNASAKHSKSRSTELSKTLSLFKQDLFDN